MQNQDMRLIDLAVQMRMITDKQAKMIKDEIQMFPGQNAGRVMIRRGMLTEEQLTKLNKFSSMQVGPPAGAPPPAASPAPAGAPSAPSAASMAAPARPAAQPAYAPPQAASGGMTATRGGTAGLAATGMTLPKTAPEAPVRPAAVGPVSVEVSDFPPGENLNLKTVPEILAAARKWDCSDVHISPGLPPIVRRYGMIHYLPMPPLSAEASETMNFSVLNPEQNALARKHLQLDFALEIPGLGRHRCNIYHQRLGWDATYRIIPDKVISFEDLGLPDTLRTLTEYHQGLILVTGPAGSGKTTTVAAMLDLINRMRTDHIITVEDPIEYVIRPARCQVTHREVGAHTQSFANALRAALREDPDVMLVGEMRDLETISIAISAAETGHLVFGTLHTNSASRTVARMVDVYPPEQREQICTMVSESMRGVVSQQLLPRKDGKGRSLAMEILVFTSAVSAQVREGKTHLLASIMQGGKRSGMRLMEDSIMEIYQRGEITGSVAYQFAGNKAPFENIKDR